MKEAEEGEGRKGRWPEIPSDKREAKVDSASGESRRGECRGKIGLED